MHPERPPGGAGTTPRRDPHRLPRRNRRRSGRPARGRRSRASSCGGTASDRRQLHRRARVFRRAGGAHRELLAEADRSNQDLEAATARLRTSRARLDVLARGARDAQRRRVGCVRALAGSMTRVAAVDLGTNSTRLLVADVVDGERPGGGEADAHHPARRRGRYAPPTPARADRACAELPDRLPPRAGVPRRRAHAPRRNERRPRRGERRSVPRRDRVELRVHHAPALRGRGGRACAARCRRNRRQHTGRGHRRRLDRVDRHRGANQPRHRLGAPDGAPPPLGSPEGRRARGVRRRRAQRAAGCASPCADTSASPARSRRWRPSTSGSPSTTRSASTVTG